MLPMSRRAKVIRVQDKVGKRKEEALQVQQALLEVWQQVKHTLPLDEQQKGDGSQGQQAMQDVEPTYLVA